MFIGQIRPMRISLVKHLLVWGMETVYPLPSEKKAAQSEGLHSVALEQPCSVSEIAALWAISEKTVRRVFDREDGGPEMGKRRDYTKEGVPDVAHPGKCFAPRPPTPH